MDVSLSCGMLSGRDAFGSVQAEQGGKVLTRLFCVCCGHWNWLMGHEQPLSTAFSSRAGHVRLRGRFARLAGIRRSRPLPALEKGGDATGTAARRNEALNGIYIVDERADALIDGALGRCVTVLGCRLRKLLQDAELLGGECRCHWGQRGTRRATAVRGRSEELLAGAGGGEN